MVAADSNGNIFDCPELTMLGVSGSGPAFPGSWIPLPPGSDLFTLPGRLPVGFDRGTGEPVVVEEYRGEQVQAVAAFVAPAYTTLQRPAYETLPDAPRLPLYCYTALGWKDGSFQVPAVRIDSDPRQDRDQFNEQDVLAGANRLMQSYPDNRLVQHLVQNCCLIYHCPAARNFALGRWEIPLPTSQACNSNCLGCISLQPGDHVCAAQQRISFTPTPAEIAEITVPHLQQAERPIASFGQGCEGEPLTVHTVIRDAIQIIRRHTPLGTINVNTNASMPDRIMELRDAGLDSMRVSLNSAQLAMYNRYFRPSGYSYNDVKDSIRVARSHNMYVSLNYFVFPGFTDSEREYTALCRLLDDPGVDMIQWRNLNIDPEWYIEELAIAPGIPCMGIAELLERIHASYPDLRFGYFNPYLAHEGTRDA
jgi:pyruvate-formate lyase-activating enzyme